MAQSTEYSGVAAGAAPAVLGGVLLRREQWRCLSFSHRQSLIMKWRHMGSSSTHFASFFALHSGCPRVERQFFEPSTMKSSSSSRAPGGAGVAGSLTPSDLAPGLPIQAYSLCRQASLSRQSASKTTTTTTRRFDPRLPSLLCVIFKSNPSGRLMADRDTGAAMRRRRLRSWWQHEQQSIAAALATYSHHSAQRQKTARAGEWGRVMNFTATMRKHLLPSPPLTHTHSPRAWHAALLPGR